MEILYGIKSKKKATQKFVLCKFKRSILNKELPIISKMSEPDKWDMACWVQILRLERKMSL